MKQFARKYYGESDAWYLVVTCKRCNTRQAMHRDTSRGKAALLRSYKWRCVQCQSVGAYNAVEVERYQHVPVEQRTGRSEREAQPP
jgi:hypothetical protein